MPFMEKISFLVPTPPSVNNLYVNAAGGRKRHADYKAWLAAAGWAVRIQRAPELGQGPFRLLVEVPCRRNRDIDNVLKPLLDMLVKQRVIADDRYVDDLRVVRTPPPGQTRVTIERLDRD